ncbi:MAG: 30S ribosomal protein S16 [bacterium]
MVVIRLSRGGKKKQAFYRIVVADSRRPVTAKFIEILGWYNPHTKELNIKNEKLETWFENGAKPSNSVAILLEKNKIKLPTWVKIKQKNKKSKKPEIAEEAKDAPAKNEKNESSVEKEKSNSDIEVKEDDTNKPDGAEAPADNN